MKELRRYFHITPNVMVEWLTLLLRIRVPGSNIGMETGYTD
jgi:hypothetical protein